MARLKRDAPWPAVLRVKTAAQVMLLKNLDVEQQLVNGSRGVVVEVLDDAVRVRFRSGRTMDVRAERLEVREREEVVACRTQIPLRLSWAMTIHKSQGQSCDLLEVDLGGCFEDGQAYTALSRATSLEGLRVLNFSPGSVRAAPEVVQFLQGL